MPDLKARFEAALLRLAAWILDRNVQRARVISRSDNNRIFEMPYDLRAIAARVEKGYE